MQEFPRIAVFNTGWSEDYREGEVKGEFGYLSDGVGHEKYNFLPDDSGRFYGYTPPLGELRNPPMPIEPDDWLVFCVSKRPGRPGLYFVGWYEHAKFVKGFAPRPDAKALGPDSDGGKFGYVISADTAHSIPLPMRNRKIKGDHIKRAYAYLRGNGHNEPWRADLADQLLAFRLEFLLRLKNGSEPDEERVQLQFCGSAERRREIETKAESEVIAFFSDWDCDRRGHKKIGYDLHFTKPATGEEMHIEVKGTSLDQPHYFMTQREYEYGEKLSRNDRRARKNKSGEFRPLWKLAVVHNIDAKPEVNVHTFAEMEKVFDLKPYALHATLRKN